MKNKIKITIEKVFLPRDIVGHDVTTDSGYEIPKCPFFEEGQELYTENLFSRPENFCGWAWRDLTTRFTKFDTIEDMDWPSKYVTYMACGDGLRPVIFKVEKLD